jgi:hypothetical protein
MKAHKMKVIVSILTLSIAVVSFSCTKEKDVPAPAPVPVKVEEPITTKVDMKAAFEKSEVNLVSDKNKSNVEAMVIFTNNETTSDQESDSVFVWERIDLVTQPKAWLFAFCPPMNCFGDAVKKEEFTLSPGKSYKCSFKFEAYDSNFNVLEQIGAGFASQQFLVYRKGMKKEDAISLKISYKTE